MTPEIPSTVYKSKPVHARVFLQLVFCELCCPSRSILRVKSVFLWNVNTRTPPYGHLGDMVTSLIRPLFWPSNNERTFSYNKPSLMGSTVNTANGQILKSQIVKCGHSFEI